MSYIYIFRTFGRDKTLLKFGYSKTEFNRLKNHEGSNPLLEVVYKAQIDDAFKREQEFHSKYKATFGLEWYEEELLETMLSYLNEFDHIDCTNNDKPLPKKRKPKYEKFGEAFQNILQEYCLLYDNNQQENKRSIYLLNILPEIKNYVDTLSTGRIRSLKYAKTHIIKLMEVESFEVQSKIKNELIQVFRKNIVYTSADVKIKIQEVYSKLKINKKSSATDLAKYFNIDKKKRNFGGKTVDSIIIL